MPQVQAKRRLVKSPPELWTELSDAAALARHLGEFGEIRITRLEPESKVVWEGDRAAGSVELDAAGWGTQVTLTVDVEAEEPVAVEPEPEPEPDPEPDLEPAPEPAEVQIITLHRPATPPVPLRRGFFARFFARPDRVESVIEAAREVVEVEPEEVVVQAEVTEAQPEPEPEPAPEPEPEAEREPDRTAEVLEHVLDQLGSAHHRPFSRA
jgi:hypothetical protein